MALEAISEQNPLPNTCSKTVAREKNALKVSKESDDFVVDEINRRDALEDPDYERYDTTEEKKKRMKSRSRWADCAFENLQITRYV